MRPARLSLVLAAVLGATLVCRAEITNFLPGLRTHPTLTLAELRAGGVAADVSYLDWGAARIELQEWIARDPVAPWVSLWKSRGRVSDADWQLLRRELGIMARLHVTPQYQMLVQEWEGLARGIGFLKDMGEWQKKIDRAPRKLGLLTLIASADEANDLPTTANFIWVQNVDAPRKAELIDMALKNWSNRRGFDEPAAWLFELGASGIVWNLPATWLAVDCFATKPDLAVKLLTRVNDPALRRVAILAIAAAAPNAAVLEPLRPLADAATWELISSK